jgi:hypothetical protein
MAATLAGALKAYIEAQGLGIVGDRDETAQGRTYPCFIVREGISRTPDPGANAYSGDQRFNELVEIELLDHKKRSANQQTVENYTLPDALARKLHGGHLDMAPTKVYGMTLVNSVRIPEPQRIRQVYTVQVRRKF